MTPSIRRPLFFAAGLAVVAGALLTVAVPAAATGTAPYCGITWGSLDKSGGSLSGAPLLTTRAGQHDCYDRLVFEFDGSVNGFSVGYRSEVYTEGEGRPLSAQTAGGALIRVQLLAPAYDQSGRITYPHRPGDHVANLAGYRTLRDVVYGGTFEGYTTFAVGVRARLPFGSSSSPVPVRTAASFSTSPTAGDDDSGNSTKAWLRIVGLAVQRRLRIRPGHRRAGDPCDL